LPLVEGTSEPTLRRRLVAWLDLEALDGSGDPLTFLEVGVGTGANLRYLAEALPPDHDAVVWGIDLSRTMLSRCARRASRERLDVRLALADAHALPFPAGAFDRVLHIGGIGS